MDTIVEKNTHDTADAWKILAQYFRHPAVLLSTLALSTLVLYSGTLSFEFVWDDKAQIVDNPLIRSLSKLHKVFLSDLWYHTGRSQLYYRPLFVVWSMLNYAVIGLRPWGWHLTAVLVHVAAVMAVFWLARKLGMEYWTAALASLLFALHPIHIECVAWISSVSDSMATMFGALAFGAFLKAREREQNHWVLWQIASFVFLACALLTKEIALGFFCLVTVYLLLFPLKTDSSWWHKVRSALLTALPYAAITVGYLLLRKYAFAQVTGKLDPKHTVVDIVLTLPYVLAFYLRQLLLPIGLTGLYYVPYVHLQQMGRFVLPLLLLCGLAGLLYIWSRKRNNPLILFAAFWMAIGLAPALNLRFFTEGDFVRDRYIYFGSIGFVILVACAIREIPAVRDWSAQAIQGTVVALLCFAYAGVSLPQQTYWDSDLLIYARGYKLYPQNPYTAIGLAREYARLGEYDRAIPLVEEAHKNNPEYLYAAYALADVYIGAGRKQEGRAALLYAQNLMPEYLLTETGNASVAAMWGKLGEYNHALDLCSRVLAKDPDLFSALYNCGNIELMAGNYAVAAELLHRAVSTSADLAGPRHFLGRALFLDGRNAEALPYLQQAAMMDPTYWDYHYWLGRSLEQSGDLDTAKAEYREALRLNPDATDPKMHLVALAGK